MENLATTKQINFIKTLNPQIELSSDMSKADAGRLIHQLLKERDAAKSGTHVKASEKITSINVKNPLDDLTALKIITDEDVKNAYYESIGLYSYKALQQAKARNNDKDIKYYEKALKTLLVVETSDNLKLLISTSSNSPIVTTLWYSDEGDIPTLTKDLFINENYRHHNFLSRFNEDNISTKSLHLVKGSYSYNTIDYGSMYYRDNEIIRPLTADELKDFKVIYKYVKDNFTDRLVKYWNRYGDKVRIDTYWADR